MSVAAMNANTTHIHTDYTLFYFQRRVYCRTATFSISSCPSHIIHHHLNQTRNISTHPATFSHIIIFNIWLDAEKKRGKSAYQNFHIYLRLVQLLIFIINMLNPYIISYIHNMSQLNLFIEEKKRHSFIFNLQFKISREKKKKKKLYICIYPSTL